ncbi:MAG: hypothetical protein AB1Z20_05970 [Desulfobacterales bacterium]
MKPVGSKTIRMAFCLGLFSTLLLAIFACGGGDDDNNLPVPPVETGPVKVSGIPTVGGIRKFDAFAWSHDRSSNAYIAKKDYSAE